MTRTRKAIRDAFCAMILEMDYPDITVKELARRATINRNTFYLHYDSLDALLQELQEEIAGEFMKKQVSYAKMADITAILYRQWAADGKRLSLEQIIQLATRLICAGMSGVVQD